MATPLPHLRVALPSRWQHRAANHELVLRDINARDRAGTQRTHAALLLLSAGDAVRAEVSAETLRAIADACSQMAAALDQQVPVPDVIDSDFGAFVAAGGACA